MMDVTNYLDRFKKKERERERDLSEKNGEQEAKIQCTLTLYFRFLFSIFGSFCFWKLQIHLVRFFRKV